MKLHTSLSIVGQSFS
jgi:Flp pilus assembly protein TadB